MEIYNFENMKENSWCYGGDTDWKKGIYIDDVQYMLKIPRTYKDKETGKRYRRNSTHLNVVKILKNTFGICLFLTF